MCLHVSSRRADVLSFMAVFSFQLYPALLRIGWYMRHTTLQCVFDVKSRPLCYLNEAYVMFSCY